MESRIHVHVCKVRGDAFGESVKTGDTIDLDLPDTFFKDTHNTRVWQAGLPSGASMFFKLYKHRGALATAVGGAVRGRAEREYDHLVVLQDAGVPTCEPLLFGRGRDEEHGRFEIVGTRAIPHARQLKAFLRDAREAGRKPDLSGLFASIRAQHRAGVYHGSLTPNNLVVAEAPGQKPVFHIIDLPRGVAFGRDIAETKAGWYDLVHFVYRTSDEVSRDTLLGVLDVYGYDDAKKARFLTFLSTYKPSKFLRWRLRTEFSLRA